MKRTVTGIAIVLLFVGCFRAASSHYSYQSPGVADQLKVRRAFDVTSDVALTKLDFSVPYSSVTITSSPSITKLHISGHVRELTENEATFEFTSTGVKLISHTDPSARFDGITLEIPQGTDIACSSSAGSVTASGLAPTKSVTLKSGYGSIKLSDCAAINKIDLNTSAGSVTVEKIKSFHTLDARSGYGSVTLSDLAGDNKDSTLEARSSSGSVTLTSVRGCKLDAKSGYGSVTFENGSELSTVSLVTSSGKLRAANLTATGDLVLKTSYGSADVSGTKSGNILVQSSSGSLSAENVTGKDADFKTSYGSISLTKCAFATLSTHTSSGRISQSEVQVQH